MRKLLFSTICIVLFSTIFTACDNTVQLNISAGANGSVDTTANGRYSYGSIITITATADEGFSFVGWNDGNTENPRTITVGKADIELTATFADPNTVDLGLPSGTLWAKRNVGAKYPWNYGNYYAWGETRTKRYYTGNSYTFFNFNGGTGCINGSITKYCYNHRGNFGKNGYIDNLIILLPTDDAATINWGTNYQMPTEPDFEELINHCYWVWTNDYDGHGVKGFIVYKAKSDSEKGVKVKEDDMLSSAYSLYDVHIFLPAAGQRVNSNLCFDNEHCEYWTSSLYNKSYNEGPAYARAFDNYNDINTYIYNCERYCGLSVRPIRRK